MTQRELPSSKGIAGVNMRLTAGSFRELHWHTADEWAMMLTGKARVSIMQPDGKMFIDDLGPGDLWYFPAGSPHSIQGLEGDGCESLPVFSEGNFSEDDTFLLAHTPPEIVVRTLAGRGRPGMSFPPRSSISSRLRFPVHSKTITASLAQTLKQRTNTPSEWARCLPRDPPRWRSPHR